MRPERASRFPNPTSPPAVGTKIDDDSKNTSQNNYKNISLFPSEETIGNNNNRSKNNKDCQCPFRCNTCKVVGNYLIQLKYKNFNDILIEDDSKLIFSFFGRDLTK